MDEASKTERIRGPEFSDQYFSGKVLDIGCGDNLVVPNAIPFDKEQGDAQNILNYLKIIILTKCLQLGPCQY